MIIGLVGKAKSGKDTVADYLVKNYDFTKVAFADGLKNLCKDMFNLTDDQVNTQEGKATVDPRYNKTPREILQVVGTDWFRSIYPMIWVDRLVDRLTKEPYEDFVITDIRFPNEFEAIHKIDGLLVKLIRLDGGGTGKFDNHPSETALDGIPNQNYSCIIEARSGELDKLYREIENLYACHR